MSEQANVQTMERVPETPAKKPPVVLPCGYEVVDDVTTRIPRPSGSIEVHLRWPTDEEWIQRQKSRRIIQKNLRMGATETDVLGGDDADAALFEKVRIESDGVSPAEASLVLNQMSSSDVIDCQYLGTEFKVKLLLAGSREIEIGLTMPTADQVQKYRRSLARVIDLPYGKQEIRMNATAASDLFNTLVTSKADSALPVVFKSPAISAIIAELDRMMEGNSSAF